ncbi:hypothetical protein BDQ17DRAFT_1422858 [Cyathus striatus]|nr:hypothetical protein BDQ17DRAFT_1422858 [Cyathus striatus]
MSCPPQNHDHRPPPRRGILSSSSKPNILSSSLSSAFSRRHSTRPQSFLRFSQRSSAQAQENQPQRAETWQEQKENFLKHPLLRKRSKSDKRRPRTRSRRSRPITPTIIIEDWSSVNAGLRLSGVFDQNAVSSLMCDQGATVRASESSTSFSLVSLPERLSEASGSKPALSDKRSDATDAHDVDPGLSLGSYVPPSTPTVLASRSEAMALSRLISTTGDSIAGPVEEETIAIGNESQLGATDSAGFSTAVLDVSPASSSITDRTVLVSKSEDIALLRLISTTNDLVDEENVEETVDSEIHIPQTGTENTVGSLTAVADVTPSSSKDAEETLKYYVEGSLGLTPCVPPSAPRSRPRRVLVSKSEDIALSQLISTVYDPISAEEEGTANEEPFASEKQESDLMGAEDAAHSSIAIDDVPPLPSRDSEETPRISYEECLKRIQAIAEGQIIATPHADQAPMLASYVVMQSRSLPPTDSAFTPEDLPVDSLSLSTAISLFCPRFLVAPLLESHTANSKKSRWRRIVATPEVEMWNVTKSILSPGQCSEAMAQDTMLTPKKVTFDLPASYPSSTSLNIYGASSCDSGADSQFEPWAESTVNSGKFFSAIKKDATSTPKKVKFELPASDSSSTSLDTYVTSESYDFGTSNTENVSLAELLSLFPPPSFDNGSFEVIDGAEQEPMYHDTDLDEYYVDDPESSVPYPDVFDLDQYFMEWGSIGDSLDESDTPDVPIIVVIPPIEDGAFATPYTGCAY